MGETVSEEKRPIYWENILFLILTHILGAAAIYWFVQVRFSWWTLGLSAVYLVLSALAISAGYHRLFSHRAYKASWPVRFFHLSFGAAAWQASVMDWASDHRIHHAETDEELDPYNIKKGFWWAHWGWLVYRIKRDWANAKDLRADPLVDFQDRHYFSMALFFGMLLPMLVAMAWNDPVGALLGAGFLRLLVQYHATFCINSWAHKFGRQPYSTKTSARDSTTAAILTMGEGYHNYHHRFPADYRNGVQLHQFDPSKWMIWTLSKIGLTWDLKMTPQRDIDNAMEAVRQAKEEASKEEPAGV